MSEPKLSRATTGFWNNAGIYQATGSLMGRRNELPDDTGAPIKLRIQKLKLVDGDCYDKGGAYWGSGNGQTFIYCAWKYTPSVVSIMVNYDALLFTRASCRAQAKQQVRKLLPKATFYH